jgi:uncharacterized membrane protein YdbT with pleckstrin-like domain
MSFEALHLEPGEKVIFQVRKHWIVFVGRALTLFISAFLPFIVFQAIKVFMPTLLSISIPGNTSALFLFFYSLWLLLLWVSFFVDWTKYYLDVWYVTEKRIIAIDQRKIFDREISNLRFEKIQDVTVDVHGFLPTLLGFGNVKVQTASEDSTEFYITIVRHPEEIRRVIFSQQNKINESGHERV